MNAQDTASRIAEAIFDVDALLKKLKLGTPRRQTWQRQLHVYLQELEGWVQILRMAIMMDRPLSEQLQASRDLDDRTRVVRLALTGSRAEQTTLATLLLIAGLTLQIRNAFQQVEVGGSKLHGELTA